MSIFHDIVLCVGQKPKSTKTGAGFKGAWCEELNPLCDRVACLR
ncbi:hypothetical protein [Nostoc linckia]|nr:hypothetical protein [Nostoc linckia]